MILAAGCIQGAKVQFSVVAKKAGTESLSLGRQNEKDRAKAALFVNSPISFILPHGGNSLAVWRDFFNALNEEVA